jgi:hypothetical protein
MMCHPMSSFTPAPGALLLLLSLQWPAAALAQAEAAPPEEPAAPQPPPPPPPPPVVAAPEVEPLDFQLGVGAQFARRLGDDAKALDPSNGFGVAAGLDWVYSRPAGLEFSVGPGFTYQRFRELVTIELPQQLGGNREEERSFTYYEFDVHHTVALPTAFVRPYLRAGIGLGMAYFSTREPVYAPGEKRANLPIVPVAAGFDVPTGRGGRIAVELGTTFVFGADDLTTAAGRQVPVFGHRASVGLAFRQPF